MKKKINSLIKIIRSDNYTFWFGLILILLFIIPFFWFKHSLYILGDDDTGLSYYNPLGSLKQFSSLWFSRDNLGSFNPIAGGELPFALVLFVIKKCFLGLNSQMVMFGLILSGSFYFVVKTLEMFTQKKSFAFLLAGLFYALSPYFMVIEYYYLMPSTYMVLLAPLIAYYLFKSIEEKNNTPLIIASLWTLLFNRALTTPAFINFMVFLYLFVIVRYLFNRSKNSVQLSIKETTISYIKLFLFVLIANAIIVLPIIAAHFFADSNALSDAVIDRTGQSNGMVASLSIEFGTKKAAAFLANFFPADLSMAQGFRDYPIYEKYLSAVMPLMYSFLFFALIGFRFIKQKQKVFLPIFILFILSFAFVSVDVVPFFKYVLILLIKYTPFFNMNRFPSMKFHVCYVYFYALMIGLLISFVLEKYPKLIRIVFSVCLLSIIVVSSGLLTGKIFTSKLSGTMRVLDFNEDYKKMVVDFPSVIKDDSNLLLFPLGYGYGSFIAGQDSTQLYRSTITGFKTFTGDNLLGNLKVISSLNDKSIEKKVESYFYSNNVNDLYSLAQKLDIKYIIYTKKLLDLSKNSEIIPKNTFKNKDYYEPVNKNSAVYENEGYLIYKINNYDDISKFSFDKQQSEISFEKISDFMYTAKIKTNDGPDILRFNEHFSNLWQMYRISQSSYNCVDPKNYSFNNSNVLECRHANNNLTGNARLMSLRGEEKTGWNHSISNDYANSWTVDTGDEYYYIAIIMKGQTYLIIGSIVSIFFVLCSLSVLTIDKIKRKVKINEAN